ncbi:MAG: prepilin peptidase [Bacilli bacterium]
MYIIIGFIFAFLGLVLGSFSNVVINHFVKGISINEDKGRSVCLSCNHRLAWYDNIPILSYILLKGKCRYCGAHISRQYLLVELFGLFSGISCFLVFNFGLLTGTPLIYSFDYHSVLYALAIIALFDAAIIDAYTKEIPFSINIFIFVLAALNYIVTASLTKNYGLDYLLGLFVPAILLLGLYYIVLLVTKVECIGLGDVILFCSLGFFLDYKNLLFIILVSSIVCSIVALTKMAITKKKEEIAFVPYIAAAGIIAMFVGNLTINAYLGLLGIN